MPLPHCGGSRVSTELAVFLLAAVGLVLWLVYVFTPLRVGKSKSSAEKEAIDWSFLRSARFWLLTGLLFFQNAAEQSVNGWMVTYFKGSGIIAGTLAAYTVTVMWGATLVGRLLIAFVFPLKNPRKAMVGMSVLCTVFYVLLVMAHTQGAAIALLFAFAISMSGLNPTAVASAGRMTSVTSMGIMLPVASSGAILMPWVIGIVAERAGLAAGMASNIVPAWGWWSLPCWWQNCRRNDAPPPYNPFCENGVQESPQTFLNPEIINNDSADDAQSEGGAHFKSFCVIPQCLLLLR